MNAVNMMTKDSLPAGRQFLLSLIEQALFPSSRFLVKTVAILQNSCFIHITLFERTSNRTFLEI